jgi:hypothetical protein
MPAVPNVSFGVIIEINQKPVALMADGAALKELTNKGLDLKLPEPIGLGQIGNDLAKLANIIHKVIPDAPDLPSTSSLPAPIQDILKAIDTLNVRVDDLRIHIPAISGGNAQDFRYALRIAAEWETKDEKKFGPITVKGIAFGVESATDGADVPKQGR